MEYLFIIGRTSELCQAELESVLRKKNINYQVIYSSAEVFHLKTETELDTDFLIKTLGGTIKIAKVFTTFQTVDQEKIIEEITRILKPFDSAQGKQVQNDHLMLKINFGLSGYGGIHSNDLNHWSIKLKENLEESNFKVRFVLPKGELSLSSVVVKKQHLTEIILSQEEEKLVLARTLAIQDFEDWGKRDFGRPCSDPHAGMLPLKVARMMVNLASPAQSYAVAGGQKPIVLDPFCGVGTILAEAMTMGYGVVGTDMSETAVQKSQKNLEWLVSSFKVSKSQSFKVFQCDATHLSEKIALESVDAIVTEPYLGPNQISNLQNIILGLDKLYLGCLREWRKILKPGGTVVMAFPSFKIGNQPARNASHSDAGGEFFVKKALDSCEDLGYTLLIGPLTYSRPQAVVKRNIYLLKYGTH